MRKIWIKEAYDTDIPWLLVAQGRDSILGI